MTNVPGVNFRCYNFMVDFRDHFCFPSDRWEIKNLTDISSNPIKASSHKTGNGLVSNGFSFDSTACSTSFARVIASLRLIEHRNTG
jgi:hypothetical protein